MNRAVFLDRDGVINELIYYEEQGIIDSPFTVEQLKLFSWAGEAIKKLAEVGYKVVIVSNQPGMAKGHLSWESFEKIRGKMKEEIAKQGAFIDGEYYCFHHPEAVVEDLRANCECRKPKAGLLLQAARELNIDLSQSCLPQSFRWLLSVLYVLAGPFVYFLPRFACYMVCTKRLNRRS